MRVLMIRLHVYLFCSFRYEGRVERYQFLFFDPTMPDLSWCGRVPPRMSRTGPQRCANLRCPHVAAGEGRCGTPEGADHPARRSPGLNTASSSARSESERRRSAPRTACFSVKWPGKFIRSCSTQSFTLLGDPAALQ